MFATLIKTVAVPFVLGSLIADIVRQKRFLKKFLQPITRKYAINDGSILALEIEKIYNYYGFGVPAILGEAFCTLRGKGMSLPERKCATALGALTGLYDDFADRKQGDMQTLNRLVLHPRETEAHTDFEKLFKTLLLIAHENMPSLPAYYERQAEVIKVQRQSAQQNELDNKALLALTIAKGGCSVLFYRMAFGHALSPAEEMALYKIGGLMQMGNDLFDVYEDAQTNTKTIFSAAEDIREAQKTFEKQWALAFDLCRDMPYSEKNIKKFTDKIALGMSRCFVCLDQFAVLQKSTKTFVPHLYTRKQLICDMENPLNFAKAIGFFIAQKKRTI